MKKGKIVIPLILIIVLFSCLVVYLIVPLPIKWAITAPIEVPICSARVANKLGIQSDFIAIKDYILQSVHVGMTPEEVEQTLRTCVKITSVFGVERVAKRVKSLNKTHIKLWIEKCRSQRFTFASA
jgi:p-aminobenzoyl-glutamate transporter AbgT